MSAAVRMRRMRAMRKLRGFKPVVTWVDQFRESQFPPTEARLHEARTLALHVTIVEKINRDPKLLAIAQANFEEWLQSDRCAPGYAVRAWRKVLRLPWPQIAALLTEQSEVGVTLRSTTPFFGVLTARERQRIFEAFRLVPRFHAE